MDGREVTLLKIFSLVEHTAEGFPESEIRWLMGVTKNVIPQSVHGRAVSVSVGGQIRDIIRWAFMKALQGNQNPVAGAGRYVLL
jgi:hypothetical protein